jgi:hypothetical protein
MLELAMTADLCHKYPSLVLEKPNHVADLHGVLRGLATETRCGATGVPPELAANSSVHAPRVAVSAILSDRPSRGFCVLFTTTGCN